MFIHCMRLTNVAQRKNNIVNMICCIREETDSSRGTVMENIGLFTIYFEPNRSAIAVHFCLLCSYKLALCKIPLSTILLISSINYPLIEPKILTKMILTPTTTATNQVLRPSINPQVPAARKPEEAASHLMVAVLEA